MGCVCFSQQSTDQQVCVVSLPAASETMYRTGIFVWAAKLMFTYVCIVY